MVGWTKKNRDAFSGWNYFLWFRFGKVRILKGKDTLLLVRDLDLLNSYWPRS